MDHQGCPIWHQNWVRLAFWRTFKYQSQICPIWGQSDPICMPNLTSLCLTINLRLLYRGLSSCVMNLFKIEPIGYRSYFTSLWLHYNSTISNHQMNTTMWMTGIIHLKYKRSLIRMIYIYINLYQPNKTLRLYLKHYYFIQNV